MEEIAAMGEAIAETAAIIDVATHRCALAVVAGRDGPGGGA